MHGWKMEREQIVVTYITRKSFADVHKALANVIDFLHKLYLLCYVVDNLFANDFLKQQRFIKKPVDLNTVTFLTNRKKVFLKLYYKYL